MGNQMTIYDISKKAGVSIATVSRVLNGSTNVKPRTRKKVMDIIDQYGYKPNAFCWIAAFLMSTFGWPIMAYQALTRKD